MTDAVQDSEEKVAGTSGVLLQARGLTVRTRTGEKILTDLSFHIEPGEMVALTGLSRSGKSALLQCLAGLLEPQNGEVLLDGISLYANLRAFQPTIGYVPADYSLPPSATVAEVLQEAARLRMPRRASAQERRQKIESLLETVGLARLTARRVGSLSGLEKRKLGIAAELVGSPGLMLIDGAAEPLAPFEEVDLIILVRELSRKGITIVQVNPRSRSAGLADEILFLAPGGGLAWFGPSEEGFAYLRGFVPRGVVRDFFGLQEALEILVNPQARESNDWARRFQESPAYQKYVDDPLNNRYPDLLLQTRPLLRLRLRSSSKEKLPPPVVPRASGLQKWFLLVRRNLRSLLRDGFILRMLALPPLVALITLFLSSLIRQQPAAPDQPLFLPGLIIFLASLTAALLLQHEISRERAVVQRESRVTPLLLPYVLSKAWLAGLLAVYQGLVWGALYIFVELGTARGLGLLAPFVIAFALVTFIGGMLGLTASALSRGAMTTAGWMLLLTVPQLLLIFDPLRQWSALAALSAGLVVLLAAAQRVSRNARA